jgi:hypothetical protein
MFNWFFWKNKEVFYILDKEEIIKNAEGIPVIKRTDYMILFVPNPNVDMVRQQPGMQLVNINNFYNIGWRYLKSLKCNGWDDKQLDNYKFSKSAHIITIGTKINVI